MKNHPLEIPYRLETIEDINKAMQGKLLEMTDYKTLLHFAKEKTYQQPPAMIKAKKKVAKDFIIVNEKKIRDVKINMREVAKLPLIAQYPLIMESIPWIDEIIRHETLFHFFHSFPPEIRKRMQLEHLPELPTSMYSTVLAIRRLLKRELVIYIKAQKTSALSLIQLKKSLVALTVFDPVNEDVLLALKTEKTGGDSPLHQNAMAETLFARLPKIIRGLLNGNVKSLVPKLSMKMTSLKLSSRNIMNLMGYVNKGMSSNDLYRALDRIDCVAMKISIPQESKNKLHHYMESMKKNMDRAPSVYRALFLNPELETWQKLYRPTKIMKSEETITERTIRYYTVSTHLEFYPTKDHFDLIKSRFSHDCTDDALGERQLMTPCFFNIRMFKDNQWIGNIYMLDFCEEYHSLLIDRVQIPRVLKATYHQFFDCLKEALSEMFEDVRYRYILMPLRISNHGSIQKIFDDYKNGLGKKAIFIDSPYSLYFESLRGRKSYYVLHKRPKEGQ